MRDFPAGCRHQSLPRHRLRPRHHRLWPWQLPSLLPHRKTQATSERHQPPHRKPGILGRFGRSHLCAVFLTILPCSELDPTRLHVPVDGDDEERFSLRVRQHPSRNCGRQVSPYASTDSPKTSLTHLSFPYTSQ